MAQKPNLVLSNVKSCVVTFSAVFCSEQGRSIVLSHPFHNLHNGSWVCPHCFARKDIRILRDGNLRICDLPIPWAQIAARAPSFFLVDLEGQSTTAFGNKVVRTLASLSPCEGEDRLGVLRKLAKLAAMVHKVAPPVLLLKPPCTWKNMLINAKVSHTMSFFVMAGCSKGYARGCRRQAGKSLKTKHQAAQHKDLPEKMRRSCTS